MQLEDYRKQIDQIDKELTTLFEKRMDIVLKVADYKKQNNIQILNQDRETQVLEKVINQLDNKDYLTETQNFFSDLFDTSRKLQKRKIEERNLLESITSETKIGIPGTVGSFSEEAAENFFSEKLNFVQKIFYPNFEKVTEALEQNEIDVAILPIQNIIVGPVEETAELLHRLKIITYTTIKISHNLIGSKNINKIKEVISHQQALAQCSQFIEKHGYTPIEYTSTSTAVELVKNSNDKTKAAIASKKAAELFGLTVLKENIANNNENYTQFVILKKKE